MRQLGVWSGSRRQSSPAFMTEYSAPSMTLLTGDLVQFGTNGHLRVSGMTSVTAASALPHAPMRNKPHTCMYVHAHVCVHNHQGHRTLDTEFDRHNCMYSPYHCSTGCPAGNTDDQGLTLLQRLAVHCASVDGTQYGPVSFAAGWNARAASQVSLSACER